MGTDISGTHTKMRAQLVGILLSSYVTYLVSADGHQNDLFDVESVVEHDSTRFDKEHPGALFEALMDDKEGSGDPWDDDIISMKEYVEAFKMWDTEMNEWKKMKISYKKDFREQCAAIAVKNHSGSGSGSAANPDDTE